MHDHAARSRWKRFRFAMKTYGFTKNLLWNRAKRLPRFITSVLLPAMLLFLSSTAGAADKKVVFKNVLLLNSYHQGFKWTDDITRGIVCGLSPVSGQIRLYFENMNTKWANFYGNPASQFFENSESILRISRAARVPVYGPNGINLGYGIVGGKLTSAFDHGKAAGEMALSILRGKPVYTIPVSYENQSRYMFDKRQLARFHIPMSLLPEGSELVNQADAFHRVRKEVVWAALGGIAVLGCVVFMLLFVISMRRKAESVLRKAHDELEVKVGERTRELTMLNQRLSSLNNQLAAVNEELNDDIRMRRQTEEQLRTSQKILSKIFEANPDHLVVMDRNLKAVQTNRQSDAEMSTDMRSRNPYCFEGLGSESGSPCEPCAARDVFRSGKPVFVEKYDARIGYLEIRAVPIFDENGDVTLVAEHIRDITERKKMEEDIVKAQKLESLGVLAGGIAHDFNNLLTAILGNISLAKILLDPLSKAHVRLVEAEKGCDRAAGLTQKLITFAKGGAPIRKAASIGSVLVVAASDMLRGSAVKCEFSLPDGLWAVEIDKGQMSQVVNNLFKNAAQAMPDGGLISVQAENFVAGPEENLPLRQGRYLRISIRDHGPGIAEEDLPRIFDPYFTTRQDGSGLGLATAYSIINKHNGYLEVETTIGAGTVFHIYLPVSVQVLDNEPDQQGCLNPGNSPQAC